MVRKIMRKDSLFSHNRYHRFIECPYYRETCIVAQVYPIFPVFSFTNATVDLKYEGKHGMLSINYA